MNLDVDPLSLPFPGRPSPGRGDIVLETNGDCVGFEYELPEDPDDIIRTIRDIVKADKRVRDRSDQKDQAILEV